MKRLLVIFRVVFVVLRPQGFILELSRVKVVK